MLHVFDNFEKPYIALVWQEPSGALYMNSVGIQTASDVHIQNIAENW